MTEKLTIEPVEGRFDEQRVAAFIETLGFAFRDPWNPSVFLASADAAAGRWRLEQRRADPAFRYPYVLLIAFQPDRIEVNLRCRQPEIDLGRRFVEWLLAQQSCRVANENGMDVTGQAYRGELRWDSN